jgi:hypothetical protein
MVNRYAFYYYASRLWLRCLECSTEIFGLADYSGGVNKAVIDSAAERHESMWHKPSDS